MEHELWEQLDDIKRQTTENSYGIAIALSVLEKAFPALYKETIEELEKQIKKS